MRRTLPVVAMLTAETGAVILLYLVIREPALAVAIASGVGAWLLGSTVVYLVARTARLPRTIAAAGRVTLPPIRRQIDRAVAASLMTGALVLTGGSPAVAGTTPAPDPLIDVTVTAAEPVTDVVDETVDETVPTLPVRSGRVGDTSAQTETSTTPFPDTAEQVPTSTLPVTVPSTVQTNPVPANREPVTSRVPEASTPSPANAPVALPATGGTHTVVAGDNLWEIAARHLASTSGRDRSALSNDEVRGYWIRLCDANREQIQSGDVNLIYPGEVLTLPPA